MQLEDHAGDVLSKARRSLGLSIAELAPIAGLSESEYAALEEAGSGGVRPRWDALAGRLGLHPDKLQRVAEGWAPAVPDLEQWRELRVITTTRGMDVNAYLIWDEVTRDAALFDSGWDAAPILALVEDQDLTLRHVFLTHGHGDHVAGLGAVRARYPKVKLHTSAPDAPVNERNRANDFIHLGSLRITHRATPGHTPDGVTYVVGTWPEDAPNVALVGDALFAGSMGGAGEHLKQAQEAVREQIFTLPSDTLVCPGHGPLTTVGEERLHNPFFL
jgi:hydroxyacylglutathione hydrolase